LFDEQSNLAEDKRERYERGLGKLFTELLWFARLLKSARN
jgi:hypothetical protein